MSEIRSSTHEDLIFDGQALADFFEDGSCWLVVLDDWEIAVLLSALRYAHWRKRWRELGPYTWDELRYKITQLEHCLMAGCNVQDLVTTQRLLIGAITGTVVDLDEPLPETGTVDFTETGLAAKFLSTGDPVRNIADILADLQANLSELQSALEGAGANVGELEDDLANVWGTVQTVATILGAASGAPVPPL
jgi:hypothetical protein